MTKDSGQYFNRVIIQSAPIALPFRTRNEMILISDMLSLKLNCANVACLKQKSIDEITTAQLALKKIPSSEHILQFFEPWVPYVDGKIVPAQPTTAISQGHFIPMPIMIGSMTEDTRPYIYEGFQKPVSPSKYATLLSALKPTKSEEILKRYPPVTISDERDALEIPATDFIFTCSIRNYSRNAGLKNGGNIWRYVYAHAFSFIKAWGHLAFCAGHVCHGSELPLLFQTANLYNFTMTSDELKLSGNLVAYWTNFAKNNNPNIGLPVPDIWPTYQPMHFDVSSKVISDYRKEFCDFWDSVGY